VAGAAGCEVQVSLFVAGAAFGEFLNESRGAKRCILQKKNASVFFVAIADLSRGMVGHLISSCWRAGENSKG